MRGSSWLYKVDAYRRLFPPEYTGALSPAGYEFQFLALWGQFLDREYSLRQPTARDFLSRIAVGRTLEELKACFPYEVLRTECSVRHFYDYYSI